MASAQLTRNEIIQLLVKVTFASVVTYFSMKWMLNQIDPTNNSKKKAKTKAEKQLKRLEDNDGLKINVHTLNDYELMIASHLIVPEDITVSWKDIAGLDSVVEELKESVVMPIKHRKLFSQSSQLWQAPKGVLLHGPPGCGKTLMAKATAKEAGMRFINLDVAMLTDKWYGESQKLASAVFTLATKLQPCIIFIDEIDSFLRSRNATDHEATAMMKTQFMMLWDGLSTDSQSTVIVMGATNRPQDLDKAILRRMPAQFHIGLPNDEQRLNILKLILSSEPLADDVNLQRFAKLTNNMSGSDLRELCRNASVYRVREFIRKSGTSLEEASKASAKNEEGASHEAPPPLCWQDLVYSLGKMKESRVFTGGMSLDNRIDLD